MKIRNRFPYSFLLLLPVLVCLFSCDKREKTDSRAEIQISSDYKVKYAKGFDIQYVESGAKLIVKSPFPGSTEDLVYNLIRVQKDGSSDSIDIMIPLEKIVATSTTHVPMLEILGAGGTLVGFPNAEYISSKETRKRIDSGELVDIGKDMGLNTEMVIALQPDAVIGFALDDSDKSYSTLRKNNIPIILNGDWLEETPLGRAEWVKFFGVLFDRDREADSIFNRIEQEYLEAKENAANAVQTPTIMSGILFKDQWNLPAGESFMAQFYKDANTNYLWKDSQGQGSLVLNFESVLDRAREAEYWIGSGIFTSREDLIEANGHYGEFQAFDNNRIYTFSKRKGEGGGILYYELGPLQPHVVLKDLIKITHPDLLPDYQPFFLQPLDP